MKKLFILFITILLLETVKPDVYLHNPKGGNNRLNEEGQNRANNNRLFDSQNNAKGGYCWGPPMFFYGGSRLGIEWTNQHGCGMPNLECEIIIQYMCEDDEMKESLNWTSWIIRDGVTTESPNPNNGVEGANTLVPDPEYFKQQGPHDEIITDPDRDYGELTGVEPPRACYGETDETDGTCSVHRTGMHEPYEYYDWCRKRDRNKGLFIADQKVQNKAIHTRQNPNGGRSGFECPEERDYYPYWHPTPWKDIVVLTDNTDRCDYYKSKSNNVRDYGYCTPDPTFNNEAECLGNGNSWEKYGHDISAPDCIATPWNRDNHLGNAANPGGYTNTYNWTIPNINRDTCVLRLRYNISSKDYDGWDTYYDQNGEISPIKDDPYIQPLNDGRELRLAIDTTQFGRTFQDRSHVFSLRERPNDIGDLTRIWNLNVRGKRGNIVQTYPATEYDFTPNRMDVREGDYIHFQWTGCDTNPNGNDGEGQQGTDRSNIVFVDDLGHNLNGSQDFFVDDEDAAAFAFLGQDPEICARDLEELRNSGRNEDSIDRDPKNCAKLNAASRYFNGGLHKITDRHAWNVYHYMSTRNNNFTNRSQKGTISVTPFLPIWAIVLVVFSGVVLLGSVVYFGFAIFAHIMKATPVARGMSVVDKTLDKSINADSKFRFGWVSTGGGSAAPSTSI